LHAINQLRILTGMPTRPPRGVAKAGRDAFITARQHLVELDEYDPARHDEHLVALAVATSDAHTAREAWTRDGAQLTVTNHGRETEHPLRRVERAANRAAQEARGRLGLTPARLRRLEREAATADDVLGPPPIPRLIVTELDGYRPTGRTWPVGQPPDDLNKAAPLG
jgi:hypothetical protein